MVAMIDVEEVERRLIDAFADARTTVVEHPDLFARVTWTLDQADRRRRFRLRLGAWATCFVLANAALALALSDYHNGRITMPWWVIELITNIVLVAIAIALGPFIKRFGRAYAADVFRANPRTGKSYLVLTDVAYYLIFAAFILFTIRFEQARDWEASRAALIQHELARVGGILLIMGLLHTANVVALPIIGNLLAGETSVRGKGRSHTQDSAPVLGPGTWLLRLEPTSPVDAATSDGDESSRPTDAN
jgi:hypothetical protein